MRHIVWLLVVVFSLSALVGGYLSGSAAVPRLSAPHGRAVPDPGVPLAPQTDALAADAFADDPAVVLDGAGGSIDADARLAVVVVDCGHSTVLESPFLFMNVPLALVIDPQAADARDMASLARRAGKLVYLQLSADSSAARVQSLVRAFPQADGIAVRIDGRALSPDLLHFVRVRGLRVFDEDGTDDTAAQQIKSADIDYAARSITIDDHVEPSYVRYMLDQAVHLARGRTALVMARPFPGTLHELEGLVARGSRDGVQFVPVP